MISIRQILCPIDFSDQSRRALDHAIAIARWYESAVTVVHVAIPVLVGAYGSGPLEVIPMAAMPVDRAQLLEDTRRFMRAETAPGMTMAAVVREGRAADEILTQAEGMAADLLVMGTHGRTGFERLVLGSVTEKVLRKAHCPVLTVPPGLPDAVPTSAGLFREILCAVDFSDSSLRALTFATSLAQEADARLTLLHAVSGEFEHALDMAGVGAPDDRLSMGEFRQQRDAALRERLASLVPESAQVYCRVEPVLTHGRPWREIVRVAGERRSELIVMGVRGRSAADLRVFGSTAYHVVREASCPVLTVGR